MTIERTALEGRSEYVVDEVFAMTGASAERNTIAMNIGRELSIQFKKCLCHIYASDMKVRILSADAGTYPDLAASCGAPKFPGRTS